jgi:hypothetical protein
VRVWWRTSMSEGEKQTVRDLVEGEVWPTEWELRLRGDIA